MTVPETHTPRQFVVPTPDGQHVTLVRTWTQRQIEEIIREAVDIVEEIDPASDLRDRTFATALNLVGQMVPKQSKIAVAPPMHAIDNGKG